MRTPGFTAEAALGPLAGRHRLPAPAPAGPATMRVAQLLAVNPRDAGLALHGRWCGPGHGGGGPPVDPVDRVCCQHDKCYDDRGYLACSCDRELVERMPAAIADPRSTPDAQAWGTAAMAFFAASPCLCHEICLPLVGCFGSLPVPGLPGTKICPPPYG